jgi:hypothetical protein
MNDKIYGVCDPLPPRGTTFFSQEIGGLFFGSCERTVMNSGISA